MLRCLAALVLFAAPPAIGADAAPTPLEPAALAPHTAPAARDAAFEATLDQAFATGDFVGLAVAVVRGGETQFLKTWGVVETGASAPVTPRTVFRIASLSKGVAATLAGIAFAEGKLKPDDLATPYAPGFALAGEAQARLSLAHLLSHRTGLPPNAYDNLLEEGQSVAEILQKYRGVPLVCPVGSCYAYQNIAYDVVGSALSSVYGMPYADLVEARLFGPLGMTTASVGLHGLSDTGDWARPHVRNRLARGGDAFGPWRAITVEDTYYRVPAAGGVNASILDMAQWLKAQMGYAPGVATREMLAGIHAPRVITPTETARIRPVSNRFRAAHYGLGWRIYAYEGVQVIAHAGTVDGYAAQIAFLPDHDAGLVVLSNARPRRIWRILPTFLDLELGLSREDWLALGESPGLAGSK